MSLLYGTPPPSYIDQALSCPACDGLDQSRASEAELATTRFKSGWKPNYWTWKIERKKLIVASADGCQFCSVVNDFLENFQAVNQRSDIAVEETQIEVKVPLRSDEDVKVIFSWTEIRPGGSFWTSIDFHLALPKPCSIPPFKSLKQGGLIHPNPQEDNRCQKKIFGWLGNCLINHSSKRCQTREAFDPEAMPSRLLNIGKDANSLIFLQDRIEKVTPYIALSHCWGNTFIPTTTKMTYNGRKKSIPWTGLTKTFQDSIELSRYLGIEHLWIDSLCIIQDDISDWNSESSKMGTIYQEATLVLSAAAAVDGNGGLFTERRGNMPIWNRKRQWREEPNEIFFGEPISHRNLWSHLVQENQWPLFKRGWTLQERLLATRVVHFTPTEMIWECNERSRCECQVLDRTTAGNSKSRNLKLSYKSNLSDLPQTLAKHIETWCSIVIVYSGRMLTKDTDMLPAISGIAKQMYRPEMGEYLAGLWSARLSAMLLWRSEEDDFSRRVHRRPNSYIAPSWSWASVVGAINFNDAMTLRELGNPVEVLSYHYTSLTNDPFGKSSAGQVTICSPTSKAKVKLQGAEPKLEIPLMPSTSSMTLYLDVDKCEGRYEVSHNEDVECLFYQYLPVDISEGLVGIVVRRSKRFEDAFERVGLVNLFNDTEPELPELKRGVFTLV